MPSPVGHALGAVAAGWAVRGRRGPGTRDREARLEDVWRDAALFAAVGLLPDLDLLLGAHSQWTHSVGAVLIVGLAAGLCVGRRSPRLALAVTLAYATHPLLDWLGQDGKAPFGILALWPFDDGYYLSGLGVFTGVSRRYWLPGFVWHNVSAVARELVILGPVALVTWWLRVRTK